MVEMTGFSISKGTIALPLEHHEAFLLFVRFAF